MSPVSLVGQAVDVESKNLHFALILTPLPNSGHPCFSSSYGAAFQDTNGNASTQDVRPGLHKLGSSFP